MSPLEKDFSICPVKIIAHDRAPRGTKVIVVMKEYKHGKEPDLPPELPLDYLECEDLVASGTC